MVLVPARAWHGEILRFMSVSNSNGGFGGRSIEAIFSPLPSGIVAKSIFLDESRAFEHTQVFRSLPERCGSFVLDAS